MRMTQGGFLLFCFEVAGNRIKQGHVSHLLIAFVTHDTLVFENVFSFAVTPGHDSQPTLSFSFQVYTVIKTHFNEWNLCDAATSVIAELATLAQNLDGPIKNRLIAAQPTAAAVSVGGTCCCICLHFVE